MKKLVACMTLTILTGCTQLGGDRVQPTIPKAIGTEVRINLELWPRDWVIAGTQGDFPGIEAASVSTGCRQLLFFSQGPPGNWSSVNVLVSNFPGIESDCTACRPHRRRAIDEVTTRFSRNVGGHDYVVRIQGLVFGESPDESFMVHVLECPIERERSLENVAKSVIDSVSICAPD